MSFITAYLYDRHMARFEEACLRSWRRELLRHVRGEVLEIGAGTGANIDHYPDQVTRLVLTEPNRHMRRILERNVSDSGLDKIQVSNGTAEQIRTADESFDCVVAFLVLCGVSDLGAALEEIQRVLKPGGYWVFLDHAAAAEGPLARRRQNRACAIWRMIVGRRANLEVDRAIMTAGFEIRELTRENVPKALITRQTIRGIAETR